MVYQIAVVYLNPNGIFISKWYIKIAVVYSDRNGIFRSDYSGIFRFKWYIQTPIVYSDSTGIFRSQCYIQTPMVYSNPIGICMRMSPRQILMICKQPIVLSEHKIKTEQEFCQNKSLVIPSTFCLDHGLSNVLQGSHLRHVNPIVELKRLCSWSRFLATGIVCIGRRSG